MPIFLHTAIYIFVLNVILGIFMSLCFYTDAACSDFQHLITNTDTFLIEMHHFNRSSLNDIQKMMKTLRQKIICFEYVSLHHEILKYVPKWNKKLLICQWILIIISNLQLDEKYRANHDRNLILPIIGLGCNNSIDYLRFRSTMSHLYSSIG